MSTNFEDLILRDITGNRPAAGIPGRLFYDETLEKLERDNGAAWEDCEPAAGGGDTVVAGMVERNNSGSYTTNSTSFADVDGTNLKVTLTTGAHRCMVGFIGVAVVSSATYSGYFDIAIDGSRMGAGTLGMVAAVKNTDGYSNVSFTVLTDVLTAAEHTFTVQFASGHASGTLSLYSNSTAWEPRLWVIETLATA